MAESQPRDGAGRPLPWFWLLLLLVPAAAVAAGTGLERLVDGAGYPGDIAGRWLVLSSAAGAVVGLLASLFPGAARRRSLARLGWASYGLAAPWVLAHGSVAGVRAAQPVREWVADRAEARCAARGRLVCTAEAFAGACSAAADPGLQARTTGMLRLGAPTQQLCRGDGCSRRWVYDGPWRPGATHKRELCVVSSDPEGRPLRHAVLAAADPAD